MPPPRVRPPPAHPSTLPRRDGRTREARLVATTRRAMLAHIGGEPNPMQRLLIDRIAALTLTLAQMDGRTRNTAPDAETARVYVATTNSLARCLSDLGPGAGTSAAAAAPPPAKPLSLAEHRANRAATVPLPSSLSPTGTAA